MNAGIDLGSSLIKIAFLEDKKVKFISSANYTLSKIASLLKQKKISEAQVVGIGTFPKELLFLKINNKRPVLLEDKIQEEIKLQLFGLKKLFISKGKKAPKDFLLVSIGTGTSYTRVKGKKFFKLPLGNSLGGGFMAGMAKALEFNDFNNLSSQAGKGDYKAVDLYASDYIIANFAQAGALTLKRDLAAGLMNIVAITTKKDLALYSEIRRYGGFKNVVYIGSALKNNECLKKLLKKYTEELDKKSYFISYSEYGTALGALLWTGNQ
ncbi:MAG: hypothetical protein WC752_01365 [Patescibacteria group bacterium]|jgi:pantothenate kinase